MVNEQTGQDKKVEENPQEVMPTSDKPAEESELIEESELSKDSSNRTKEQFEKLKKTNKQLSEKLKKFEKVESKSVLDDLEPKPPAQYNNLTQQKKEEIEKSLVDGQGYVDVALLNQRLEKANDEAARAKQEVAQIRNEMNNFEKNIQVRETHKKYPKLDPESESFDKRFYDLVSNELIGQMMKGKKDFMAAADKVNGLLYKGQENPNVKAKMTNAKKKKEQAEQINATTRSKHGIYSSADQDQLVAGTMSGKKGALAERLRRAGIGPN